MKLGHHPDDNASVTEQQLKQLVILTVLKTTDVEICALTEVFDHNWLRGIVTTTMVDHNDAHPDTPITINGANISVTADAVATYRDRFCLDEQWRLRAYDLENGSLTWIHSEDPAQAPVHDIVDFGPPGLPAIGFSLITRFCNLQDPDASKWSCGSNPSHVPWPDRSDPVDAYRLATDLYPAADMTAGAVC